MCLGQPFWYVEGVKFKVHARHLLQLEANGLLNTKAVEWSVSRCRCFTLLGTHLTEVWVIPSGSSEVLMRQDILALA